MKQYTVRQVMIFICCVCLVCSLAVSLTAVALKPRQEVNAELDMQKNVLQAAGLVGATESPAPEKIKELFGKMKVVIVDLEQGREVEGDASKIDLKVDSRDPDKSTTLKSEPARLAQVAAIPKRVPCYKVMKGGKATMYVLPIWGKGLWSTLWGFIALEPDTNTIAGLTYYQHGETPGLGGEVDNPSWKKLWPGRKAFAGAIPKTGLPVVAIKVKKGIAGTVAKDPHNVDGLSGATITSRGVGHMLALWLGEDGYGTYLKNIRAGKAGPRKKKRKKKD